MKTAEITRHKQAATGIKPPSTWALFADIYRKEGIAGVNKGVNAVAVRQCTNWGSRQVLCTRYSADTLVYSFAIVEWGSHVWLRR
jgi:hypothetical protein